MKKLDQNKPNFIKTIIAEVTEEEKDSNFGDYGTESDSDLLTEEGKRNETFDA